MTTVRIEINRQGIADLLASAGVQSDLDARAARVAQTATSRGITVSDGSGEIALPIASYPAEDATRARALVVAEHAAGLAVESKHRLLVSSLDAASG